MCFACKTFCVCAGALCPCMCGTSSGEFLVYLDALAAQHLGFLKYTRKVGHVALDALAARNTVGHVALDVLAARNTVDMLPWTRWLHKTWVL